MSGKTRSWRELGSLICRTVLTIAAFFLICAALLGINVRPALAQPQLTICKSNNINDVWGDNPDDTFYPTTYPDIYVFGTGFTAPGEYSIAIYDSNYPWGTFLEFSIQSTTTGNFMVDFNMTDSNLDQGLITSGIPWVAAVYNFGIPPDLSVTTFDHITPSASNYYSDILAWQNIYVGNAGGGGGGGGGPPSGFVPVAIAGFPSSVSVLVGGTQLMWIGEVDSNGDAYNISSAATCSFADPSEASCQYVSARNGDVITGLKQTPLNTPDILNVTWDGFQTTVPVTVIAPVSIAVSPDPVTLPAGETQPLTVTATMSDNSTQIVTAACSYQSADSNYVTVSSSGVVEGVAQTSTPVNVTVTYENLAPVTVPVTVTAPVPTSIAASPNPVTVIAGEPQQLTVTANMSDGTSQDVTAACSYKSADSNYVNVSGSGLVEGVKQTSTPVNVTVTYETLTTTDPVTVLTVTSIAASPASFILTDDGSSNGIQQLDVIATMSDNSTQDVTAASSYQSSDSSIASVSGGGQVTGNAPGSASITVSYDGITAPPVDVGVGITAIPASITMPVGGTQQLTVKLNMPDGTTTDITSGSSYYSENSGIASVGEPPSLAMYYPGDNDGGMFTTALYHPGESGSESDIFIPGIIPAAVSWSPNGYSLVTGLYPGSTTIDISYLDYNNYKMFTTTVPVTVTPPIVAVYSDSGYTQPWTPSTTSTTAYVECSGLAPNTAGYTLVYEDPAGDTVENEGFSTDGNGIFESVFPLSGYPNQTGMWTVILDNANSTSVASTTFYVNAWNIPEFPTWFAGILVMGLCAAVYFWMRKRHKERMA